jgi:hypothetical protein
MARLIRGAIVAAIAVLVGLGGTLPAHAVVDPTPSPTRTGYPPPEVSQFTVSTLAPVCDNDVPYLTYNVEPSAPSESVTITFINPGGTDVVYADEGLSGAVLWPGAVPGPDGKGVDWPGWSQLPDGTWVEGDEYDWVRPSVQVQFQSGDAEATVTVAYPPSTPSCLTDPPGEEVLDDPGSEVLASNPTSAVLSATGSDAGPLAALGAGLVVIGALAVALVAIARRRRATS